MTDREKFCERSKRLATWCNGPTSKSLKTRIKESLEVILCFWFLCALILVPALLVVMIGYYLDIYECMEKIK